MAHSGVAIEDGVIDLFSSMKLKKSYAYVQFKITDDLKSITVDKCVENGTEESTYEAFIDQLPPDDCRYAVFDYHFSLGSDRGDREKLVFVVWCPDVAKVKKKMLYASSKDALRKKLVGIAHECQATEFAELARDDLEEKLKTKSH